MTGYELRKIYENTKKGLGAQFRSNQESFNYVN